MNKFVSALLGTVLILASGMAQAADSSSKGIKAFENREYAKAHTLLIDEADSGSTKAIYTLGLMYENGLGVQTSKSQAASYYSKGAKLLLKKGNHAEARVFVMALERVGHDSVD